MARVYTTSCKLKLLNRAIVIDLTDANLPTQRKDPHMTVLYVGSIFNESYQGLSNLLEEIRQTVTTYLNGRTTLSFSLVNWGQRSDKVTGELHDLAIHIYSRFGNRTPMKQRAPHVDLR